METAADDRAGGISAIPWRGGSRLELNRTSALQ
jgi:hypothetical protein